MRQSRVITIGNFDGVHLGHQAILRRARELADAAGLGLAAVTFDPHPATILRPQDVPPRLMTLRDKRQALIDSGADEVIVMEPTIALLSLEPDQFIEHLCTEHRPAAIVEGPDFRFGRDRKGDVQMLRRLGESSGFDVHRVDTVEQALCDLLLAPVRSSLIRWLIGCGRVADAAICLGRPHAINGVVQRGEQRGSTIGIPTANLDPAQFADMMISGDGVYAGHAVLPDGQVHPAAISVGAKPTFGRAQLVIEAHLLDFDGDLYDKAITLHFTRWLRDQQRFPSVDALTAQMRRDIAACTEAGNLQSAI